jgi:hypothetical protein
VKLIVSEVPFYSGRKKTIVSLRGRWLSVLPVKPPLRLNEKPALMRIV